MRFKSPILAFVLAALMIATSGAMATARGVARDAAGQMVLCTGMGPVTVLMDTQGQPIGKAHYCPDCALGTLAFVDGDAVVPKASYRAQDLEFPRQFSAQAIVNKVINVARGPPAV
ncbi:hypothetical protein EDD53_2058 [Pacificibacter maritimus]|uniref:DUF2946 family protein n=1 Tax=Pacificibacter maritimus TaxID=762213 RepID=A0A3N4U6F7_9RHOB|nr:hypothetical protein [Pacificibacter maritimus]RPE66356.1 hypothetical protein EDD53_2058 [Pacificibacter maritimus]